MALLTAIAGAHAAPYDFTYSGSVASWQVPTSGNYDITAYGAQGGGGSSGQGAGEGAEVSGQVYLTGGTTLQIVVGGTGISGLNAGAGSGGGGGSFVYETVSSLLAAAGGGGGLGWQGGLGLPGQSGTAGTSYTGRFAPNSGAAGTNGQGGAGASDVSYFGGGGGGAGWLSNGGNAAGSFAGDGGSGPASFAGGAGYDGANGGFGGGGGGGGNGAGSGGGFSGGGGSGGSFGYGGGGGGSYLAPQFTDTTLLSGVRSGNGYVTIDYVGPGNVAAPEPATGGLLASALGLGLLARRAASLNCDRPLCPGACTSLPACRGLGQPCLPRCCGRSRVFSPV